MKPSSRSAPPSAAGDGYVVLERDGLLWGVAGHEIRALGRPSGSSRQHVGEPGSAAALQAVRLTVAGGELDADRVLAVVPHLDVRPAPGALVRFWPEAAVGLAVFADRPVLVIDGQRPPAALGAMQS